MAYPGEGYKMSSYGYKPYNPEQIKEQWRETTAREVKISQQHATTKPNTKVDGSIDYFDNYKHHGKVSTYDQTFAVKEGYCQKLKRDDFQHTQGLDINAEEVSKNVPILSNSIYGHRKALEHPTREHVRVAVVRREFYRSCGTNIASS